MILGVVVAARTAASHPLHERLDADPTDFPEENSEGAKITPSGAFIRK
jgi:hypothetical protein